MMCARNFNARYCVTWSSTGRSTGLTRDAETTAALIKTSSINPLGEVTLWPSSKLERLYLGQGLHCSLFWKSKFKVNGVIYWYLPRNWWIFCWMSYKIINYTNFEQQKLDSFSFVKNFNGENFSINFELHFNASLFRAKLREWRSA